MANLSGETTVTKLTDILAGFANGDYFAAPEGALDLKRNTKNIVLNITGKKDSKAFFKLNCAYLTANGFSIDDAIYIASFRCVAYLENLYSADEPSKHNYRDTEVLDAATWAKANADKVDAIDDEIVDAKVSSLSSLLKHGGDILGAFAVILWQRGHHWAAEDRQKIDSSLRFVLGPELLGSIKHELIANHVLHAVFMDDFKKWTDSSSNRFSAPIRLRLGSAPAGAASLVAGYKLYTDVKGVFPGIDSIYGAESRSLNTAWSEYMVTPAAFSINRNFYTNVTVRNNETEWAPLLAACFSILKSFDNRSSLLDSKALTRLAESCPVSSAAVGRIALKTIEMPEIMRAWAVKMGTKAPGEDIPFFSTAPSAPLATTNTGGFELMSSSKVG